jgi:hypothetical protein
MLVRAAFVRHVLLAVLAGFANDIGFSILLLYGTGSNVIFHGRNSTGSRTHPSGCWEVWMAEVSFAHTPVKVLTEPLHQAIENPFGHVGAPGVLAMPAGGSIFNKEVASCGHGLSLVSLV